MFFDETVTVKDSKGQTARFSVSTPTAMRLSFELSRTGDHASWRPHFWGGEWKALDLGFIRYNSGQVCYCRSYADLANAPNSLQTVHLDVFLCKGGAIGADEIGLSFRAFLSLNGRNSGSGKGYLDHPYAVQGTPGEVSWDVPGRDR